MPNPVQDIILVNTQSVTVSLEPSMNALYSLWLLMDAETKTGLGEWVARTTAALTPKEQETHRLVIIGLYPAIFPKQSWSSFPAYVDHLAACDSLALRDKILQSYAAMPSLDNQDGLLPVDVDMKTVLESVDSYLDFLRERFGVDNIDQDLEAQAYLYVVDPPKMQNLIVTHLRKIWNRFLAPEWERIRPMLQDTVAAFRQIDFSNMSKLEAAQLITGQAVKEKWRHDFQLVERIIFVPTTHIGPYVGKFCDGATAWIFFGPRVPDGVQVHTSSLGRAEITVRLNALADDNRLGILKLLSESGELRSQDIMHRLGLSQSAASRHLKQLSATGYIFERRSSGAKCYKLNPQRIRDTLHAISVFLLGDSYTVT
ncbi:MAG: metalloregulator ArsR/SmtB family transcription factor [Chloroflexi bacterium]|nr:metalloregulator ArsR/SmtB family transcription factor [Chloroflexota bacterium]